MDYTPVGGGKEIRAAAGIFPEMRYNFVAMSALSQALSQAASALIRAIRMVGKSAADEPKPEEIQSFRQRAEAGDVNAQRALSGAYLNGMGVPQNYEEAAKWIRPAAEREDDIAQCLLGMMHYRGNGVRQNHAEAINLFPSRRHAGKHYRAIFYGGAAFTRTRRPAKLPEGVCLAFPLQRQTGLASPRRQRI